MNHDHDHESREGRYRQRDGEDEGPRPSSLPRERDAARLRPPGNVVVPSMRTSSSPRDARRASRGREGGRVDASRDVEEGEGGGEGGRPSSSIPRREGKLAFRRAPPPDDDGRGEGGDTGGEAIRSDTARGTPGERADPQVRARPQRPSTPRSNWGPDPDAEVRPLEGSTKAEGRGGRADRGEEPRETSRKGGGAVSCSGRTRNRLPRSPLPFASSLPEGRRSWRGNAASVSTDEIASAAEEGIPDRGSSGRQVKGGATNLKNIVDGLLAPKLSGAPDVSPWDGAEDPTAEPTRPSEALLFRDAESGKDGAKGGAEDDAEGAGGGSRGGKSCSDNGAEGGRNGGTGDCDIDVDGGASKLAGIGRRSSPWRERGRTPPPPPPPTTARGAARRKKQILHRRRLSPSRGARRSRGRGRRSASEWRSCPQGEQACREYAQNYYAGLEAEVSRGDEDRNEGRLGGRSFGAGFGVREAREAIEATPVLRGAERDVEDRAREVSLPKSDHSSRFAQLYTQREGKNLCAIQR